MNNQKKYKIPLYLQVKFKKLEYLAKVNLFN